MQRLSQHTARLKELFFVPIITEELLGQTLEELMHQPASQPPSNGLTAHQLQPSGPPSVRQPLGQPARPKILSQLLSQPSLPWCMDQLPLSAIDVSKLKPCSKSIHKFQKLRAIHKAPTLAVKLAQLSFFGDDVLAQCTAMGCREYHELPSEELYKWKQALSNQFTVYLRQPKEFEPVEYTGRHAISSVMGRHNLLYVFN